jgi:hypothetical protein
MAKELRADPIHIEATPAQVWAVLTDFDSFPRWNPFIRRASGELATGQKLSINLRLYGKTLVPFQPTLTMVEAPNELRWLARMGLPGVMDVERFFIIEAAEGGGSTFRQGEDCTGVFARLFLMTGLEGRILAGYARLNTALKKRAERLAATGSADPVEESAAPIAPFSDQLN